MPRDRDGSFEPKIVKKRQKRLTGVDEMRPRDVVYPVIFIDAIHVKIRDGAVANRPIYVAWFTCCGTLSAMPPARTGTRSPNCSSLSAPRRPSRPP